MLPVIPLVSLGVSLLLRSSVSNMTVSKASGSRATASKQSLTPEDEFCLMLANIIFRIDGRISDEEGGYLKEHTDRASENCLARIDEVVNSSDTFVGIRNWYNGLRDREKDNVVGRVQDLVSIDRVRAQEEEAFLVQFAQIVEGHGALSIFVSMADGQDAGGLLKHNLFRALSRQEFLRDFSASECPFTTGAVYIEHPFIGGALMPFAVEEFENAQDRMYDGIIDVLKDLGAKRMVMSESRHDKVANQLGIQAAADAGYAGVGVSVNAGANFALDEMIRSKQAIEVRFDGSKPSLLDRMMEHRWKEALLNKYAGNKQYQTIISGRFGPNKIKYFSCEIKSDEARKLVKGINAAAKLDKKLIKAGASFKQESTTAVTQTVEKCLSIDFH